MTGSLPSRFIPRRGPLIALGLLVVALLAAVTLSALPVDGSAQAQEAEPTGRLVLVPDDLWVGETTEVIGFHLEFPDKSITVEYSEHFVPTGETCEDAEAGSASFASSPARIALTACAVGEGRVRLLETNTDNVVAEATAAITEPEAAVTGEQQGCIDPNTFGPCTPDAPSGLDALVLGQRDIAVTWNRLNGATMYRLAHQPEGGSVKTSIVNGTGKSFVVDKGSTHRFRVQAFGNGSTWKAEWGSWSGWVEVTTDSPPTITITRDSSPITEGPNKSARFTLHADPAFSFSSLTININVSERGDFLRSSPTTVHLGRNRATASLSLPIVNDSVCENHGSVTVEVRSSTGHQGYIVGSPSSASVTIRDDDGGPNCDPDPITVMFGADSYPVTEGSRVDVTVNLSRTPGKGVEIPVTVSPGSNVTVSFGGSQKSKTFPYTARQDSDCDDETVNLSFGDLPAGIVRGMPSTSRISITDDDDGPNCDPDPITVMFGADSYPVTEGSRVDVTVNLSRTPGKGVEIPVTVSPGSNVTVSFGGSQKSKTFPYTAPQDNDCNDETVNLSFGDLPAGIVRGTPDTSRISITDDDSGPNCDPDPITVMFGSDSYSVTEGSRRSITVNLSRSPGENVDIPVTVSPGSNETLRFSSSQTSRSFTYTAPQDSDCDDETVNLSFGDLPAGIVRGTPSTSRISITDNDTCRPVITVSALDDSPVTEGESATFRIWANPAPRSSLSVNIDVTQTEDYLSGSTPSTATIPGSRYFDLSLPTEDDNVYEAHGSVQVEILQGYGYTVGGSSTATVDVMDNDPQQPQMLPSTTGDGTITLTWEWNDDVRATSYVVQQWFGEGSDPRFRTLPFGEYTISFSATNKTRSATIEGLTNATSYTHRVISVNSAGQSPPTQIDTDLPLAAPTNLDVIPREGRRAKLTWKEPRHNPIGTTYQVQFKPITTSNWHLGNIRSRNPSGDTELKFDLDNIVGSEGLGDDPYEYHIQIIASLSNGGSPLISNNDTNTITIIDSPINSINGDSSSRTDGKGEAVVKWEIPSDVTGYSLRWRKLKEDHTSPSWELNSRTYPDEFTGEVNINNTSLNTRKIPAILPPLYIEEEPMDLEEIYAVQLNYTTTSGKVFSARDRFVWTSDKAVGDGQRIATIPLNRRLENRTFSYIFCDETFPKSNNPTWEEFTEHAIKQWMFATDNLITIDPLNSVNCANYEDFVDAIRPQVLSYINDPQSDISTEAIESYILALVLGLDRAGYQSTKNVDLLFNEVVVVDDVDEPLKVAAVFDEVSRLVGHGICPVGSGGCAYPGEFELPNGNVVETTDILLWHSTFRSGEEEHVTYIIPELPEGYDGLRPQKDDIMFETCGELDGLGVALMYRRLIHEAGHALGIFGGTKTRGEDFHHPYIADSQLSNYRYKDLGYQCGPLPLDVMAMYAMYQNEG